MNFSSRRCILRIHKFLILGMTIFMMGTIAAGAASVDDILKAPVGSGGLNPGMTKAQVVERYGDPDMERMTVSPEWKEPREEWFYRARMEMLPVNAGYLSDDLYLYFDGDNLTTISKRPLGKGVEITRDNMDAELSK